MRQKLHGQCQCRLTTVDQVLVYPLPVIKLHKMLLLLHRGIQEPVLVCCHILIFLALFAVRTKILHVHHVEQQSHRSCIDSDAVTMDRSVLILKETRGCHLGPRYCSRLDCTLSTSELSPVF